MNIYATQDYVDNKISVGLQPPPKVTSYTKPTSIPVQSGTQIVFYGSSQGTMSFKLGNKTYTKQLADMNDVGWVLWIQTSDVDGSLIEHGARNYFDIGQRISEIGVTWAPASGVVNPNWIIITIN